MIAVENIKIYNLAQAVYDARNAMNSWDRSDSDLDSNVLGENDLDLAKRLIKAGPEHRKWMRQVFIHMNITAPCYWISEFDTYKIGTTKNSCSFMHKGLSKPFDIHDFSVMDMKGNYLHLYSINSPFLLLIFNHPECSLCHKTEENIESNSFIQRLLIESKLKVLAITIDAERGEWERHAYPKNWIVGLDVSKEIYSKRLYDIQRLPSLYLLDKEKRVLLKEADYSRLHKYLLDNSILFEY